MSHSINKIKQLINQPRLSANDVICLISQVRILLEETHLSTKYKYLHLYCNWTLHPNISNSLLGFRILEQLTDILLKHHAVENDIIHEVSNVISIPALRNDFIGLFKHFGLPTVIFDNRNIWKDVFGLIAHNLIDKPLTFPKYEDIQNKPQIKAIYDSILNKAKNTDLAVNNFSFVLFNDVLFWKIQSNKKHVDIISPVIFLE